MGPAFDKGHRGGVMKAFRQVLALAFFAMPFLVHPAHAEHGTEKRSSKARAVASVEADKFVCRVEYQTVGAAVSYMFTGKMGRTLSTEEFRGKTLADARTSCKLAIKFRNRYPSDSTCRCNQLF